MKILFDKAFEALENIHVLRSNRDVEKIGAYENLLYSIDDSLKDELFLRLNIYPEDYFMQSSNAVLRKLLNYCYTSKDLFLQYYNDIYKQNNDFEMKLTNLKIIISSLLKTILTSRHISISRERYNNYLVDIEIYNLKDILAMGYKKIPCFRYYNTKEKKMVYVNEKPIDNQIEILSKSYSAISTSKTIGSKEEESLTSYSYIWWNKYREFIDTYYYDIRHLFEYYKGASIKFLVCKSIIESETVDTKSGLVLYEIKSIASNGLHIEIDRHIYDYYFFELDDSYSVLATLGYSSKTMADGSVEIIEKSIEDEINNELLDIIRANEDTVFFDSFTNLVLNLHGYNQYKFDDCYIKRDLSSDSVLQIAVIKYTKTHKIDDTEMRLAITGNKYEKIIFVYEGLFLSSIRKEFFNVDNVVLLDVGDLVRKLKYMLNESVLSKSILNDFIKPTINKLQLDSEKTKQIKIADMLINDLNSCPPGKGGWKEYESICYRAIRYLFEDGFAHFRAKYQLPNDIHTDIRDLILLNSGRHEFWKDIKLIYKCNNIIIEFKNYNDSIGNDAFRQISDYLEKDVHGQFGLIFARKNLDDNSRRKQIDYLKNRDKKLILVITDENLIDMIHIKSQGDFPEKILMGLKFSLETSV